METPRQAKAKRRVVAGEKPAILERQAAGAKDRSPATVSFDVSRYSAAGGFSECQTALDNVACSNKALPRPTLVAAAVNAVHRRGATGGLFVTEPPRMHNSRLFATSALHLVIGFVSILLRLIRCAHEPFPS
jgi:hypothetical protein